MKKILTIMLTILMVATLGTVNVMADTVYVTTIDMADDASGVANDNGKTFGTIDLKYGETVTINVQTSTSGLSYSGSNSGKDLVTFTGFTSTSGTDSFTVKAKDIDESDNNVTLNYSADSNHSFSVKLTVTKADVTILTSGSPASGLTYNGQNQMLLSASGVLSGSYTADGENKVHFEYALGSDGSTAPTSGWSSDIPVAKYAGTYYVWQKVVGNKYYNDVDASYLGSVAIATKANLTEEDIVWEPSESGVVYTGENLVSTNFKAYLQGSYGEQFYGKVTLESTGNGIDGDQKSAGSKYEAKFVPDGSASGLSNYSTYPTSSTKTYEIIKATPGWDSTPTAVSDLVYSGTAHDLVTAGTLKSVVLADSAAVKEVYYLSTNTVSSDSELNIDSFSGTVPQATDAGTYYVYYAIKGNGNYNDVVSASNYKTVVIAEKSTEGFDVSVSGTYTYNGNTQTPIIIVKDGDKQLTEGIDYTVSYSGGLVNAGNVEVSVSGSGSYSGTTSTSFTIEKAPLTVNWQTDDGSLKMVYTGTLQQREVQSTNSVSGTIYNSDEVRAVVSSSGSTNVGTHVSCATLEGKDKDNYKIVDGATAEYEIVPKEITVIWDENTLQHTYDGNTFKPSASLSGVCSADESNSGILSVVVSGEQKDASSTAYTATASLSGTSANNYTLLEKYKEFNINPKGLNLSWGESNLEYNGENQAPTVSTSGIIDADVELVVSGSGKNVGNSYTATASLTGSGSSNYVLPDDHSLPFSIYQKVIDVIWGDSAYTYDGQLFAPSASLSGVCSSDDNNKNLLDVSVSGQKVDAGNYTATATLVGSSSGNYEISTGTQTETFAIGKATATVVWNPSESGYVYDGKTSPVITASLSGVNNESYSGTVSTPTTLDPSAGTEFEATFKVDTSQSGLANYNYSEYNSKTYKIVKATPEWDSTPTAVSNLVYSGDAQDLVTAGTLKNIVEPTSTNKDVEVVYSLSDKELTAEQLNSSSFSGTIPQATAAGTYYVYYAVKGNGNYNGVDRSIDAKVKVTIAQKPVTNFEVSVSGTYEYDGNAIVPSTSGITVKDGDTVLEYDTDYTLSYENNIKAGEATVTVSGKGNYTGTVEGHFTIDQRQVTLDWDSTNEFKYNGYDQYKQVKTINRKVAGNDLEIVYSEIGADAGTYKAKASLSGTDAANYVIVGGTEYSPEYKIVEAIVDVIWDDTSFTYNGKEQILEGSLSGLLGVNPSENVVVEFTGAGVNADTYTATASISGTGSQNYKISESTKTHEFTINPKEINVTWEDTDTFEYDGNEHYRKITSFGGMVENETVNVLVSGGIHTDAGSYTTVATVVDEYGHSVSNYCVAEASKSGGAYTITPKQTTVTWTNTTHTYDGQSFVPNATLDGECDRDLGEVDVEVTGEQTDAGTYTATASLSGSRSGNYNLENPTVQFTIEKAPINVIWNSENVFIYDNEYHWRTIKDVTGRVNGDDAAAIYAEPSASGRQKVIGANYVVEAELIGSNKDNYTITDATRYGTYSIKSKVDNVIVDVPDFNEGDKVYVDGVERTVAKDANNNNILEVASDAKVVTTYTYTGVGSSAYPTGMKVYNIVKTDTGAVLTQLTGLTDLLNYKGTSIRLSGDKGIRIKTSMTQANKAALTGNGATGIDGYIAVEYGTAMGWESVLNSEDGLTLKNSSVAHGYAYKRSSNYDKVYDKTDDDIIYTNVLVGTWSKTQCEQSFVMRPYVVLRPVNATDSSKDIVVYGGIVTRSIQQVANQYLQLKKPNGEWYYATGSSTYNYLVNQLGGTAR